MACNRCTVCVTRETAGLAAGGCPSHPGQHQAPSIPAPQPPHPGGAPHPAPTTPAPPRACLCESKASRDTLLSPHHPRMRTSYAGAKRSPAMPRSSPPHTALRTLFLVSLSPQSRTPPAPHLPQPAHSPTQPCQLRLPWPAAAGGAAAPPPGTPRHRPYRSCTARGCAPSTPTARHPTWPLTKGACAIGPDRPLAEHHHTLQEGPAVARHTHRTRICAPAVLAPGARGNAHDGMERHGGASRTEVGLYGCTATDERRNRKPQAWGLSVGLGGGCWWGQR